MAGVDSLEDLVDVVGSEAENLKMIGSESQESSRQDELPVMISPSGAFVDALPGLRAYGPSLPYFYQRSATYMDNIRICAKPSDPPVEQPTKFELVINVKTAKAIGLTMLRSQLLRVDEVFE